MVQRVVRDRAKERREDKRTEYAEVDEEAAKML